MKFTKKNIQKSNRNGVLIVNSANSTFTINSSNTQTNNIGNYLPATSNGDGTYTVNLDKVFFNGNISASGEMTAYKQGLSNGGDSSTEETNLVVYDGLDSKDSKVALSANQGRILKELIDNKADGGSGGGTSADLSNYYDKATTDSLFQPKGNYLTSIPSEYITETELNNKGYITSSSLNGYAKTSQIPTKVSQLTNDKNYLTSHQSITHLAKKDGSNVSGTWDNLSIGGNAATADILKAYKHNEYDDMLLISGTRSDGSHSRKLIDDGFDLVFEGKKPKYLEGKEKINLATVKDNVASATKLQTPRQIWGKAFDGSTNISGILSKVGGINFENGTAISVDAFGNIKFAANTGSWNIFSSSSSSLLCVHNNNNVGIGTNNPTAKLDVNGNIKSSGEIYADSDKKVWHSGNLEVSDNIKQKYILDLTDLPTTNFYPTYFSPSPFELDCEIHSPSKGGSEPFNQNHIHFLMTAMGWSDTYATLNIISQGNYDDNEITIGAIGKGNQHGGLAVWLRGGMSYECNSNRIPLVKKGNYQHGDEYYAYGTQLWGGANRTVSVLWKNDNNRSEYNLLRYRNGGLKINGNIRATGEITAFATNTKTMEETPVTMALADEDVRVYDGLDSTDSKVALSANQGYILMNTIQDLQTKIDDLQKQINDLTGQ